MRRIRRTSFRRRRADRTRTRVPCVAAAEAERAAIEMMISLMDWCPAPVHIVHLSSASSLGVIRAARARGLPITAETCPHYLTFAAEGIADGATEYKCAPPIRDSREREALWNALISGDIDLVASDHSPLPAGPEADWRRLLCSVGWHRVAATLAVRGLDRGARTRRRAGSHQRMDVRRPARLAGLGSRAGSLVADRDADIVIWDPDASYVVNPGELRHRHPSRRMPDASSSESSARRMLEVAASSTIPHSRPLRDHDDSTIRFHRSSQPCGRALRHGGDRGERRVLCAEGGTHQGGPPEWREGVYTERGKWMDGWETRAVEARVRLGDHSPRPSRDRPVAS